MSIVIQLTDYDVTISLNIKSIENSHKLGIMINIDYFLDINTSDVEHVYSSNADREFIINSLSMGEILHKKSLSYTRNPELICEINSSDDELIKIIKIVDQFIYQVLLDNIF